MTRSVRFALSFKSTLMLPIMISIVVPARFPSPPPVAVLPRSENGSSSLLFYTQASTQARRVAGLAAGADD